MGILHYGATGQFTFDDHLLAHLRTVILGKLSLQESFAFTWVDDRRHSLWLHPTIQLHFEFDTDEAPEINPKWIEQLFALANSPSGLRAIPEPKVRSTPVAANTPSTGK